MSSFTPGPWGIVKDKRNINYGDIESCYNGALVCLMPEIDSGLEDELISEADARLIAAAPEMYDLLNKLRVRLVAREIHSAFFQQIPSSTDGMAEKINALLRRINGEEDHND